MVSIMSTALGAMLSRNHLILVFLTSILGRRYDHTIGLLDSLHRCEPTCLDFEILSPRSGIRALPSTPLGPETQAAAAS